VFEVAEANITISVLSAQYMRCIEARVTIYVRNGLPLGGN